MALWLDYPALLLELLLDSFVICAVGLSLMLYSNDRGEDQIGDYLAGIQ